jgi:ADP-heptose:LPS heptosyltransferase
MQRHLCYDLAVLRSDFRFEAEIMLDMLNLIGCKTDYPPNFHLNVEPAQRSKPYVIYFTSASTLSKCWPEENFAELIKQAAKQYPDMEHLVLEGRDDWESVDTLMAKIGGHGNVKVIKAMPLDETMALLKGARLVVCNDTGIRNLAIALDTHTLGIFYTTVPYRYWPRYDGHDAVYMADGSIPPVEVVAASLDRLLARNDA